MNFQHAFSFNQSIDLEATTLKNLCNKLDKLQKSVPTFMPLSRPEPHRASLRLLGEDQPHAELLLQQRGGRGKDVEASSREFRAEA